MPFGGRRENMIDRESVRAVIVDDNAMVRKLIGKALISSGCVIAGEAETAHEALELCRSQSPDLVLLDILLPDGSGKDVLKQIKTAFPNITVVMLSAISDEEIVEECFELGAFTFIQKTTPYGELKRLFRAVIDEIAK